MPRIYALHFLNFYLSSISPCNRRSGTHPPSCRLIFFVMCCSFSFKVCHIQSRQWNLSTHIIAWYYSRFLWSSLRKPLGWSCCFFTPYLAFLHRCVILAPSLRNLTQVLPNPKVLLTIGLQYETAGRGSLALYTSVCLLRPPSLSYLSSDLCDRSFLPLYSNLPCFIPRHRLSR
jgi:hypothetical protein